MAHDIFISYAPKDRSAVEEVRAALEAQGISCWIAPRNVLPGENETESMLAAIDASFVVVLCLSSAANASKLVTQQAARAFNKKIPIVPLRIEDVEPSDALRLFIGAQEPVDAYVPPLEANLAALVTVVRSLLKEAASTAGVVPVAKPPYEDIAPTARTRKSSAAPPRDTRKVAIVAALAILACIIIAALVVVFPQAQLQPAVISSETSTQTLNPTLATPSPILAPTQEPSVTPTSSAVPPSSSPPTPPPPSRKIATSIRFVSNPTVVKGDSLGINVISSTSGLRICSDGAVTATIGTVSSGGSGNCYYTAYLDTSSLNPGTYSIILNFAGDSTYQPSQITSQITITAQ